jgi:hypothetical protein
MTQQEVLERLCALCTEVMAREFGYEVAADCFCNSKHNPGFQFSPQIIRFIEEAVTARLPQD